LALFEVERRELVFVPPLFPVPVLRLFEPELPMLLLPVLLIPELVEPELVEPELVEPELVVPLLVPIGVVLVLVIPVLDVVLTLVELLRLLFEVVLVLSPQAMMPAVATVRITDKANSFFIL
jgi:hypothetical protein